MGFLSDGDYLLLLSFCGVKTPSEDFVAAVAAAEAAVEAKCGPVLNRTVADVLTDTYVTQVLSARVASLASVTSEAGVAGTLSDFRVRGQLLSRRDGVAIPEWTTVVYTSGWHQGDIPADLMLAGRLLARHLWRTQLGNQRVNDAEPVPGSAWMWPRQAIDLARRYELAPLGFA